MSIEDHLRSRASHWRQQYGHQSDLSISRIKDRKDRNLTSQLSRPMLQKKKISFLLTKFGVDTGRYGPFGSVCFLPDLPVLVSIFFCSELLAQGKRAAFKSYRENQVFCNLQHGTSNREVLLRCWDSIK